LLAAGLATAAAVLAFAHSGTAASLDKPSNTSRPTISGTPRDNETLNATTGSWTNNPTSYSFQWQRCDDQGNDCTDLQGATSSTYEASSHDVGRRLVVLVTATNTDGSASRHSLPTDVVQAALSKPSNTSPPTIAGTPQDNQTLTATPGKWSGTTPITFTYSWLRCDANGNGCAAIGSTSQTYRATSNDVGHRLRVTVTAKNSAGSTAATSVPTNVATAAGDTPKNTAGSTIAGVPQDNQTLTANAGTWTGTAPITLAFQWLRCDANGSNCGNIQGATGSTYKVTSSDVGHRLRVTVTAKNSFGSTSTTSGPTAVATAASPTGAIQIGSVSLPNRLVVDRLSFTPRTITSRSVPILARFHVVDSSGRAVAGALVYAIGVPANRVSVPRETATDTSGWATVSFVPLRALPLRRGALLTIFVRARKGGENPLGGVSARRLVSVRVQPN
jgi:hypothetical protein